MNKADILSELVKLDAQMRIDSNVSNHLYAVNKIRNDIEGNLVDESLTSDFEIDKMLRDCIKTFHSKGAEYTVGSQDRLANFRGAANDVGIPMEKAWFVFFNKHLRAIQSYIKNGCVVKSNETIQSRIMDCIVYLLLFNKMSLEIERGRAPKEIKKLMKAPTEDSLREPVKEVEADIEKERNRISREKLERHERREE